MLTLPADIDGPPDQHNTSGTLIHTTPNAWPWENNSCSLKWPADAGALELEAGLPPNVSRPPVCYSGTVSSYDPPLREAVSMSVNGLPALGLSDVTAGPSNTTSPGPTTMSVMIDVFVDGAVLEVRCRDL